MVQPISPCKDCSNRSAGCHSNCEVYMEFFAQRREFLEEVKRQHNIRDALDQAERSRANRRRR